MRIDRNILYKAVTIIMVVTVLVLSVYIMVNKLGLVEGYDFGGGAYYYVDIPEFEKIVNQDGTEAVDGLKTGYINAGGSSVVLTGTNKGRRAIVIVLGSASASLRDSHARSLMVDALSAL